MASILLAIRPAYAQEALRYSLAGDAAAESRRHQQESQPYTIKQGDFRMLVTPSVGLDWNDSINISQQNAQSDFILKPMVDLSASYPLTRGNLLALRVGVGYDQYLEHDEYSGIRLSSGSELSFDIYVKDFLINLHDRFSYTQDSAGQAAIASTANYGGLENTAGISTTWDLQDVTLSLGYDHQNFISSSSEFDYTDRNSEMIVTRAGFRLNPRLTSGIEGSGTFTAYDKKALNESAGYSAGLYADWKPGTYFQVQPRAGYAFYDFTQTSQSLTAKDQDSWYAGLTLSHQISDAVSLSISAGHELRLGIQTDATEAWYARPNVRWNILKKLALNPSLFYEHGKQGATYGTSTANETYDWYGGSLGMDYELTKKLKLSLNYRVTFRQSNIASRDYTQNLIGLRLAYQIQ